MLNILLLALLFSPQARPSEKCSLSGTVVDSITGDPLNKVELLLLPIDRQANHTAVTTTSTQGHFQFVDLDPGSYRLRGKRNQYLEIDYGSRRPNAGGTVVRLEQGQSLGGIEFRLVPAAVISGTVRDSDGEPLDNAQVNLLRYTHSYGRPRVEVSDSTGTDDRGEYRFRRVSAGKYYIGVESNSGGGDQVDHSPSDGPAEKSVPTLYPGVPDTSMAAPIEVAPGGRVTGIDVTLLRSRVFRISGRVVNVPPTGRVSIVLRHQNGEPGYSEIRTPTRDAAGNFELRGVPPGSYELNASTGSLSGTAVIAVGASDVEGVRLAMAPGAEIKLHIAGESDEKLDLSGVAYFLTANGRSGYGSTPFQGDRFTARNVLPDHYTLQLFGSLLRQFYVKSARTGETDVLADGLTIAGPGAIDIQVILASDGATLEGLVAGANRHPVPGATVLLAPDTRSRAGLFKTTTTDQNGRYGFTAVAPGDYKVFAWQDIEPEIWSDPDFLKTFEKQGENTSLKAKSHASVSVRLAIHPDPQ